MEHLFAQYDLSLHLFSYPLACKFWFVACELKN